MSVLTIVSNIMIFLPAIYYTWIMICGIVGMICKKPHYAEADPLSFAILVCARNEEAVIGNLLESLKHQDYPEEKMKVFVVAHNCSDATAAVAREYGAEVFERNDPNENCKGYALRYGISRLKQLYPERYQALCVFDADNLAARSFLKEMNAALKSGADMAQGYRNSKNYYQSTVSELFGSYWHQIMICQNLPHTAMGLPITIGGTGFAVTMDALGEGWETFTMVEDMEFSCQMALRGKKSVLAPYAVFYDEQPVSLRIALRQRYRWAVGGYQLIRFYFGKLLRALPALKLKAANMLLEISINLFMLVSLAGVILQSVEILATDSIISFARFVLWLLSCVWFGMLPTTLITLWRQRLNPIRNLRTIILFPFFLLISMVFAVPALLDRHPTWKPIPHSISRSAESMEDMDMR